MKENAELPQYILLVDDDEILRAAIEEYLNIIGFLVITAGDGKEAIEIIDRMNEQINLLITDLCMPILDGISIIRHIRQFDANLPIVVITGYANNAIVDMSFDINLVVFNKPLDFNVLHRHLQRIWPWIT